MSIQEFLYKRDSSKLKVIAGDIPQGLWDLTGSTLSQVDASSKPDSPTINLSDNIKTITLKNDVKGDQYEGLVGAGVGALLVGRFLGPIGLVGGAVAGYLLTANGPQVSVSIELADDRTFMAVMHPDLYSRIKEFGTTTRETAKK